MKAVLLAALASILLTVAANATDLPTKKAPPQAPTVVTKPSWTGFYVGVYGGGGWGQSDADWTGTGSQSAVNGYSFSTDSTGALAGGQVGYDYEFNNGIVLGAVADIAWSGIKGSACADITHCTSNPWPLSYSTYEVKSLSTIRARLGYGVDNLLGYLTGGLAIADTNLEVTNIAGTTPGGASEVLTGYAVGAGLEYRITQSISVGAEYLYADFSKRHSDLLNVGNGIAGADSDLKLNIVKASLNYRF